MTKEQYDNHDCHLSSEDGCTSCEAVYEGMTFEEKMKQAAEKTQAALLEWREDENLNRMIREYDEAYGYDAIPEVEEYDKEVEKKLCGI